MEENKVNIEVVSIDDLIQDSHNFNKGNEQGAQLLERSFRECGAGRSVLIDKDNRLVEGIRAPFTQGGGLRRGCGIEIDTNLLPDMIEPYGIDLNLLPDMIEPMGIDLNLLPDMIEAE